MRASPGGATPPLRDVEQQVARVLNSPTFSRSQGPARLLRHLLQKLTHCGGRPATQQELATVLGLATDFDPASNPLVRMHMSKLRKMLHRHATGDGRNDRVILEIPRNQYQLRAVVNCKLFSPTVDTVSLPTDEFLHRPVMLVTEFACRDDGDRTLAVDMAVQLLAMLAEVTQVAAIGPALRSRLHTEGLDVRQFAHRCLARFALDGELLPDRRGLAVVARVVDVPSGEVLWSDWIEEPTDAADPAFGNEPLVLAARLLDKLRNVDPLRPTTCVTGDRSAPRAVVEPAVTLQ